MEQIEFRIYPDGRVEEIVTGVKGVNCNKVTEEINNALGKVIATKPTEEMFEQEIVLDQSTQLKNKIADGWEDFVGKIIGSITAHEAVAN